MKPFRFYSLRIPRRALLSVAAILYWAVVAPAQVTSVDGFSIPVSDLQQAVRFYEEVLSFETVARTEVWGEPYERLHGLFGLRMQIVRMRLGQESLDLVHYLAPEGRPIPVDSRSNDHWFQHIAIVVSDMDHAYTHLRSHHVRHASTGPQRIPDWNQAAAGIEAFYFKDPDGHVLEIISFPSDKGDPRWQAETDRLFLGIDHTAIVVADTETSLRFYRDRLGMRIAGSSENYGIEQERLNNVFGARLRITALKADHGPGVEFLEYLAPADGRPYPLDTRANDLWHWQTLLTVENVENAAQTLHPPTARFISPGPVDLPKNALSLTKGLMVRDPDGHALLISE